MTTHQQHNIPWNVLDEIIYFNKFNGKVCFTDYSKFKYFFDCMDTTIKEFSNSTPKKIEISKQKWRDPRVVIEVEEENDQYNPFEWDPSFIHCGGGQTPYFSSLTCGYVMLNLLLVNREKYITLWSNCYNDHMFNICCGRFDGSHPDFMSDKFKELFDREGNLKEFTVDIVEKIIEICKVFFRCLYTYKRHDKRNRRVKQEICWLLEPFNTPEDFFYFD